MTKTWHSTNQQNVCTCVSCLLTWQQFDLRYNCAHERICMVFEWKLEHDCVSVDVQLNFVFPKHSYSCAKRKQVTGHCFFKFLCICPCDVHFHSFTIYHAVCDNEWTNQNTSQPHHSVFFKHAPCCEFVLRVMMIEMHFFWYVTNASSQ